MYNYVCVQCLNRAVELCPGTGHVKYLYLGQLSQGETAAQYFTTAIDIMRRQLGGGRGNEREREDERQRKDRRQLEGCLPEPRQEVRRGGGVEAGEPTVWHKILAGVYLADSLFFFSKIG